MRTPARFKAETKYVETTEKKANTNLPLMARVGDGGGVAAVVGRDNFYHVRMYNDDNRATQCHCMLPLANNDWIYMVKARDRSLTYYDFVAFIQLAGGGTGPPVQVHDHSAVAQGGNTIDLNGGADNLILDADGDTTISAPVDDQIDFEIAGADDFTMTANAFNVLAGSSIVMADGTTIGQAAGPLLTFDDTLNYLEITGCDVGIGTATPGYTCDVRGPVASKIAGGGRFYGGETGLPVVNGNLFVLYGMGVVAAADIQGGGMIVRAAENWGGAASGTEILFYVTNNGAFNVRTLAVTIQEDGDLVPGSSKTQDLGLSGSEWDDLWWVTSHQGTSRLVDSTQMCPVCNTRMRRSTGTSVYLGDDRDYALVFCTSCGNTGVEEWQHLTEEDLAQRKPAPKIIFEGARIKPGVHGRQVALDFHYVDAVLDKDGDVVEQAVRNSTRLGETEFDLFMAMTESERLDFIRAIGVREWEVREEAKIMKEKASALQVEVNALVNKWTGKDLLKTTAN